MIKVPSFVANFIRVALLFAMITFLAKGILNQIEPQIRDRVVEFEPYIRMAAKTVIPCYHFVEHIYRAERMSKGRVGDRIWLYVNSWRLFIIVCFMTFIVQDFFEKTWLDQPWNKLTSGYIQILKEIELNLSEHPFSFYLNNLGIFSIAFCLLSLLDFFGLLNPVYQLLQVTMPVWKYNGIKESLKKINKQHGSLSNMPALIKMVTWVALDGCHAEVVFLLLGLLFFGRLRFSYLLSFGPFQLMGFCFWAINIIGPYDKIYDQFDRILFSHINRYLKVAGVSNLLAGEFCYIVLVCFIHIFYPFFVEGIEKGTKIILRMSIDEDLDQKIKKEERSKIKVAASKKNN